MDMGWVTKVTKAIKDHVIWILSVSFFVCGAICVGIGAPNTRYVKRDIETTKYLNDSLRLKSENLGCLLYCDGTENGENNHFNSLYSCFMNTFYSMNFSGFEFASMPALVEPENGAIRDFDISFGGENLFSDFGVASGGNYTNQESLVRFEMLCINLYKYQPKNIELSFDSSLFDGFVYIPDYLADVLISASNGKFLSYDDLISLNNKEGLIVSSGDATYSYRIANVFHVNGFNRNYCIDRDQIYNDYDTGAKLQKCFGNFIIVSNIARLAENDLGNVGLALFTPPQKYSFLNVMDNVISSYSTYVRGPIENLNGTFLLTPVGRSAIPFAYSNDLSIALFKNADASINTIVLLSIGYFLIIPCVLLPLIAYRLDKSFRFVNLVISAVSAILLFACKITDVFLKQTYKITFVSFNAIWSSYFLASLVLSIAVYLVLKFVLGGARPSND